MTNIVLIHIEPLPERQQALKIKLSASELILWAESLRWFYPATMKLSTYLALRKDRDEL